MAQSNGPYVAHAALAIAACPAMSPGVSLHSIQLAVREGTPVLPPDSPSPLDLLIIADAIVAVE